MIYSDSYFFSVKDEIDNFAFDNNSASVIKLNNGTVLYFREVGPCLAVVCILREENFERRGKRNTVWVQMVKLGANIWTSTNTLTWACFFCSQVLLRTTCYVSEKRFNIYSNICKRRNPKSVPCLPVPPRNTDRVSFFFFFFFLAF